MGRPENRLPGTRAEMAERVAALLAQGLNGREISERLGLSTSYTYALIRDPAGSRDRERKRGYCRPCVDCGAPTKNGSDGVRREPRCVPCGNAKAGAERKVWTRDALLDAIWTWAERYGEPPASCDWNPTHARYVLHDEARAARGEDPQWPHAHSVRREFGSWAAALTAAGFEPYAPHGGGGNQLRRRSVRDRAAA